jgi:folate-binding protein YgfZ
VSAGEAVTGTAPLPDGAARPLALDALHAEAGAVFVERLGWRLPLAYGPPERAREDEYRAAREGAALLDLSDRGLLAATGPGRQKFLHAMLSNAIDGLPAGSGCLAALMDVKGHLSVLLRALVDTGAVLLEMPTERVPRVRETLLFYKVGAPVRFEERAVTVLALIGPQAAACLARAGATPGPLGPQQHQEIAVGGRAARATRASDLPGDALVLHVPASDGEAVWSALRAAGARPTGRAAFDALRVEEGRVLYGTDVTEENLLHETGLVSEYHSPTKGCYLGQEVVARLEGRGGNVSKRLRGLRLAAPAERGSAVHAAGAEVGRITTAAVSPRFGPVALAYVHRSAFAPGTAVTVDGQPATVVAPPFEAA